jgi:hypothetical protein
MSETDPHIFSNAYGRGLIIGFCAAETQRPPYNNDLQGIHFIESLRTTALSYREPVSVRNLENFDTFLGYIIR